MRDKEGYWYKNETLIDRLGITFTPVMGGKMDKGEKILKAIKLSKEITSPYKRDMESILYAFEQRTKSLAT